MPCYFLCIEFCVIDQGFSYKALAFVTTLLQLNADVL